MWGRTAAKKGPGERSNVLGVRLACLCRTHQGWEVASPQRAIGIFSSHHPHLILHRDLTTPGPSTLSLMEERWGNIKN